MLHRLGHLFSNKNFLVFCSATQNLKNGNSTSHSSINKTAIQESKAAERERIRQEFYATYDVMTGIRIAATLSCLFLFFVFLVVYKGRNKANSVLNVSYFFFSPELA